MKFIVMLFVLFFFSVSQLWATQVDNSIESEINKLEVEEFSGDFSLKTFSSCSAMDEIMDEYIQDYWKNNSQRNYYYNDMVIEELMDDSLDSNESETLQSSKPSNVSWGDFSSTNTQIQWVDESDIIKTDGKYVYFYNQDKKSVFIWDVQDPKNLNIIKEIKIPNNIYSPVLYIDENRLIIVGWGYINTNPKNVDNYYAGYNNTKTFTIVFDTTDIENPSLIKMFVSDGNFSKSRKIWDHIYLLSNKWFHVPYYLFDQEWYKAFDSSIIMPKSMELTKTSDVSKQNTLVNNKKYPYEVTAWDMVDCNEISYSFPDKETFQEVEFSPNFNIISAINIRDVQQKVETDVIAWNSTEIFMSQDNLYITDRQYIKNNFRCAAGMMCIQPFFFWGSNTIVHKLNIDKQNVDYQTSALIPGSPLNQYSMDEHDGNFRIITQKYSPEKNSAVYVLDENLKLLWSLDGLGKTEDFKSSRFMWDKLFLVTFEQIDPFYVIDMSDNSQPKVLWELKIPGYSTYLHPYDENHIIWIWYNTTQNKWWGTINDGIKIDLYEIDYDRKPVDKWNWDEQIDSLIKWGCTQIRVDVDGNTCWLNEDKTSYDICTEMLTTQKLDSPKCVEWNFQKNLWDIYVAQKFTKTIGEYGSSSEATYNPRMFMWNANKNMLLLPAKIFINSPDDQYKKIDFYQGLFGFEINKDTGITQKYKTTHIDFSNLETKRENLCNKYSQTDDQTCKELIDGTMYCTQKTQQYVPTYCYADSSLGEFKARFAYDYSRNYIKRALWIWDTAISVSTNYIMTSDLESWETIDTVQMK